MIDRRLRRERATALARDFGFNPARLDTDALHLSGGNQQKLVLGKWLNRKPRVLLLDEPTRGIDLGAKQEIFQTIRRLSEEGMAVILVSSDLEEVVEYSDRVLVMARGNQIGLLAGEEPSVERILNLIFAVEKRPEAAEQSDERSDQQPDGACRPAVPAWREHLPNVIRVYGIIATLVILVAVVAIGNPAFLSQQNIFNMMSQWAPAGIMAVGMTYVILTGGFDLSIASGYSLCAVVAAYVGQGYPPSVAFAAAILVGLLFGLANGLLVAVVRINPFITTVGSGFVITGIALVMTENAAFLVDDPAFSTLGAGRWNGIPYSGMLLVVFFIVFGLILHRTVYGEAIYAVGGNYEASRLSGIRVRLVVASTYVVLGGCVGLAGSIAASQLSSAQANLDPGIIFDVLTIVVVGGTSLSGGVGAMWRTAVGLGIIATISNGFVLLDISPYYQSIIKGSIIVAALALDTGLNRLVRAK